MTININDVGGTR